MDFLVMVENLLVCPMPLLLVTILIWSLVKFHRVDYAEIAYPDWGVALR